MSQTIKTDGGKILQTSSANGVKGMLLRTLSPEKFFFRVYHGDGNPEVLVGKRLIQTNEG